MQNECAFLAGALAALTDASKMPLAKNSGIVSVVGGADSPVINDFVVGFIQGAKYVNPQITVLNAYIASVSDSPKCKDVSLQMYAQKSSVNFSPSGGAVMGSMDAAKQAGQYVIGVDADQAMQFLSTDPELANLVISSALKNVGQSLYVALQRYLANEIPWGSGEVMGIEEGAVGLAKNEVYKRVVPTEIQAQIETIEADLLAGKITVRSAFSMNQEELNRIRAN
jgi:basic membrane protein A